MICFSVLLLFWTNWVSAEWQPKVTSVKRSGSFMFESFDDSDVILGIKKGALQISRNAGTSWKDVKAVSRDIHYIDIDNNFAETRAFVFDVEDNRVYATSDKGESWFELNFPRPNSGKDADEINFMSLASNPFVKDDLLLSLTICPSSHKGRECFTEHHISSNGKDFKPLKMPLEQHAYVNCRFLSLGAKDSANHDVICDARYPDDDANFADSTQLKREIFLTSDYGKSFETLSQFKGKNIRYLILTEDYAIVSTSEDKYNDDSVEELWVSQDGRSFENAVTPTNVRGPYFVSQISKSSKKLMLMADALGSDQKGTGLILSDSDGLRFSPISSFPTEIPGFYMMSSVGGLEGAFICSFTAIQHHSAQMTTKITFDDGRSWSRLRLDDVNNEYECDSEDVEKCFINSFFMPSMIFNTHEHQIPGVSYVIGSVEDLTADSKKLPQLQTFATTNGGESWRKILDFPAAVQFGDHGNVVVAFPFSPDADGDPAMEFFYSLDQGETWTEYELKEPVVLGGFMSTSGDSSGSKFIMRGSDFSGKDVSWFYTIDFSDAFEGKQCTEDDLEDWVSNKGECVGGAKRTYKRRKPDARCFVRDLYADHAMEEEICQCSEIDYECSPEFFRADDGTCKPDFGLLEHSGSCKAVKKGKELKLSPKKLQRGNKCENPIEIEKVTVSCNGLSEDGEGAPIIVFENFLDFELKSYQYFNTKADETVLFRTDKNDVYLSYDSGKTIKKFAEKVTEVVFNPYFNTSAYVFGADNQLQITNDRARSFETFDLPEAKQLGFPLSFHATEADTFIFYGGKNCDSFFNPECHAVAYITRNGGTTFEELKQGALSCEFVGSIYENPSNPDMIMCLVKDKGKREKSIITSSDYFETEESTVFEDALGYVSLGEYTVIAVPHENDELRAFVTINGDEYAEAKLPAGLNADKQQAYTVLGSQKGAIFFHLTTHMTEGQEYGALMKSNSNGTSFVTLERSVNRGSSGFVDFEKIEGLEGIIMINTVFNAEQLQLGKEGEKKLRSKISFNDGADWTYLQAPKTDSEGNKYDCNPKDLEKCSLSLHGYTEREDQRDTYSSGSALGYMIGVGNVGEHLLPKEECSTFMSVDGGFTWNEVAKGAYQWEYGDHGSIVVLVKDGEKTDSLLYSLTSGKSWSEFKFAADELYVEDIVTTPQDSAMRFLLIGKSTKVTGRHTRTFTIDFTKSFERQCALGSDDYAYHSFGDCLFGHQAEYLQKVNDHCYNGAAPLEDAVIIVKHCSCTRMDFECDYNYYKAGDGTCKLVDGTDPLDGSEICEKYTDQIEYFEPTGYRKIPLSTCVDGLKLDEASRSHACPGFEKEFKERYSISGRRVLYIITVPLVVFVLAAWFVYDRGVKRNGGFSRFGEIRLGDEELIEENRLDKMVNSIVKVGVIGFSGLVTAKQLSQRVLQNTWQRVRSRLPGNKNGPTYSSLNHDQFLDEADELLAEHDEDANDLTSFLENESNFDINEEDDIDSGVTRPYSDEVGVSDDHEEANDIESPPN
ncbi:LANO_0F04368g1_1 [Lachancea nothofagi CBS 11611]|uniref:LANO_0F04368g1_1 n=1 Tax=Lachancea nothofagi CBS 11611 TaxID=1266666 RepID=A0A1G4K7I5_9SACH|nr:LANO_0F04368g1_1 [Lachancea nothofagi CBS 11611]